jgi:pyrroline-5-carboxylate reductase
MSPTACELPADLDIAFIGGGNMARALIGGLRQRGLEASRIRVGEPQEALRAALAADFGLAASADNRAAVSGCRLLVLAVKPQVLPRVLGDLAQALEAETLLISVAAGISCAQLDAWAGGGRRVVRCMPNTPALIGQGACGLYANPACRAEDRQLAESVLGAVGVCAWIDQEPLMDVVTALSGSGPAYLFLLAEAMQAAAEREGLPAATARLLARQTLIGAAGMLAADPSEAAELRRRVTSPGGTTQAAVESLQSEAFEALIARAIHAARRRGAELSAAAEG